MFILKTFAKLSFEICILFFDVSLSKNAEIFDMTDVDNPRQTVRKMFDPGNGWFNRELPAYLDMVSKNKGYINLFDVIGKYLTQKLWL